MKGKKNQGEMYSPNESGEYTPRGDASTFTVQGLRDALTEAESMVTEPSPPADEFIIQLEVTMADRTRGAKTPTLLMEWRLSVTRTKERPSFKGLRTHAGGWPRACVSILL